MQCSNSATDSAREKLLSECDSNNKSLLNGSLLQSLNWLSWAEVIMEKNLHPECLDFVSMTDRVLQSYQQRIQRMKRTETLFFAACILSLGGVTGTNSLIRHHNTTHAPGRSLESDQSNVKQVEWSLGLGRICSWIVCLRARPRAICRGSACTRPDSPSGGIGHILPCRDCGLAVFSHWPVEQISSVKRA